MTEFTNEYRKLLVETLERLDLSRVEMAIAWLREARDAGRQVFVIGNGGSASTASHLVCDLVKGASYGREKRFKVMALNDNVATLTAYSNDVGYDAVFVEQLKNFAAPGDVLIAISGSGNSPNVLRAMEWASQTGLHTIALTGRDGGQLGKLARLNIHAEEPHMGRIEDAHLVVAHMIGYYFMEGRG